MIPPAGEGPGATPAEVIDQRPANATTARSGSSDRPGSRRPQQIASLSAAVEEAREVPPVTAWCISTGTSTTRYPARSASMVMRHLDPEPRRQRPQRLQHLPAHGALTRQRLPGLESGPRPDHPRRGPLHQPEPAMALLPGQDTDRQVRSPLEDRFQQEHALRRRCRPDRRPAAAPRRRDRSGRARRRSRPPSHPHRSGPRAPSPRRPWPRPPSRPWTHRRPPRPRRPGRSTGWQRRSGRPSLVRSAPRPGRSRGSRQVSSADGPRGAFLHAVVAGHPPEQVLQIASASPICPGIWSTLSWVDQQLGDVPVVAEGGDEGLLVLAAQRLAGADHQPARGQVLDQRQPGTSSGSRRDGQARRPTRRRSARRRPPSVAELPFSSNAGPWITRKSPSSNTSRTSVPFGPSTRRSARSRAPPPRALRGSMAGSTPSDVASAPPGPTRWFQGHPAADRQDGDDLRPRLLEGPANPASDCLVRALLGHQHDLPSHQCAPTRSCIASSPNVATPTSASSLLVHRADRGGRRKLVGPVVQLRHDPPVQHGGPREHAQPERQEHRHQRDQMEPERDHRDSADGRTTRARARTTSSKNSCTGSEIAAITTAIENRAAPISRNRSRARSRGSRTSGTPPSRRPGSPPPAGGPGTCWPSPAALVQELAQVAVACPPTR